ncbi:MAG: ATP-binding cassette domain-containing protein [Planctomycetia bacterium]|jgi:ABC-2 type transport system ATP-binding protein|nr:ATP-binding cassette domain-containing protein [Planctomycetia bacterium]
MNQVNELTNRDPSRPTIGEPIVEAVGLTKIFSDFWKRAKARAVDGIDFEINRHEIFGLLGPNGSGKSTTIKMILGLLHKSSGRLSVFGRDPSDVAIKSKIGYLPEESYLYRFLDARETLDYYGRIFGLDHRTRKRRIDELLDMVGLAQVKRRAVGEYSKGMSRRLGLAQALINDPELLILDEPTSGLDPIGTRQVKDLLLELGRRGTTILLSSHLLGDVEDVCDRMVILYGGKIRGEGRTGDLLADSQHTVIRTPTLDADAVDEIEGVLRRRGVAIDSVQRPRQRLEDLFMGIVEQAQEEAAGTSGALQGGETAAFLTRDEAVETEEGESLLDALQSDRTPDQVRSVEKQAGSTTESTEKSAEVLDELLRDEAPTLPEASVTEVPDAPDDHDNSVIDGLLGGEGDDDEDRSSSR